MIYEPAEDSYLLQDQVKLHAKGKVLEIGIGSGIQSNEAAQKEEVESVIGVDINPEAVVHCKATHNNKKLTFIESNLFENINEKFDTIIFNPPYLPYDKNEPADSALATTGGKHGYELTRKFLDQVNDYLNEDGIILLLFSNLTKQEKINQFLHENLLEYEEIVTQKMHFEKLFVYKIQKNKFRKELEKHNITNLKPLTHGKRGLIFTGTYKKNKVSIKIQRSDIGAMGTVNNESTKLIKLNKNNIGPNLLFSGEDYFVYDFIDGDIIMDFFDKSSTIREDVISILRNVLNQMRTLDKLQLNKEEMHHPLKHILITKDKQPILIDFERCKSKERLHNVTQFVQFLLSTHLEYHLKRFNIEFNKNDFLEQAKVYSSKLNDKEFKKILELLK